ncbi:MAG TPA: hypothetical protein VMB50_20735 [Myxococcales bacterium]|nr:hypothetical protein [Myxococcales bacterium]
MLEMTDAMRLKRPHRGRPPKHAIAPKGEALDRGMELDPKHSLVDRLIFNLLLEDGYDQERILAPLLARRRK